MAARAERRTRPRMAGGRRRRARWRPCAWRRAARPPVPMAGPVGRAAGAGPVARCGHAGRGAGKGAGDRLDRRAATLLYRPDAGRRRCAGALLPALGAGVAQVAARARPARVAEAARWLTRQRALATHPLNAFSPTPRSSAWCYPAWRSPAPPSPAARTSAAPARVRVRGGARNPDFHVRRFPLPSEFPRTGRRPARHPGAWPPTR